MRLWARIRSWFRAPPADAPRVDTVEVALSEEDLFEEEPAPAHDSSIRLKTAKPRMSPFDAQTRRVDLEHIAKSLDQRASPRVVTR